MSRCFQKVSPRTRLIQNKIGEIKSLEEIESEYDGLLKKHHDDQNEKALSEHEDFSPEQDLIVEEDDNYDFHE